MHKELTSLIETLITESSEYEFKVAVEKRKPKSWLKSVSAFANSFGGTIIFGVDDEGRHTGLNDIKQDVDDVSQLIATSISPLPIFSIEVITEEQRDFLILTIPSGRATPYFYQRDGGREVYIRSGNTTIPAPEHILRELVLKGTNTTFDGLPTDFKKLNYSFSLLEATYFDRLHIKFQASDYSSFGLTDGKGYLTNAGKLMADQYLIRNSRLFCTRWNGLIRGSIFDDALDTKEYEGNLITLLNAGQEFVKNNSKIRFAKHGAGRIEKPDYSERAVLEALVNALIHRDYLIVGSEIHIHMYDDRLEIQSPGGMVEGEPIQNRDIMNIRSARRNPILADLFHRLKYMERRGSGLSKIISETEKLPGYTSSLRPEFYSTTSDFRVVLKNLNYHLDLVTPQVTPQVSIEEMILQYCSIPRTKREIVEHFEYSDIKYFSKGFLKPLLESGRLQMTFPDKPSSPNQKYVAAEA